MYPLCSLGGASDVNMMTSNTVAKSIERLFKDNLLISLYCWLQKKQHQCFGCADVRIEGAPTVHGAYTPAPLASNRQYTFRKYNKD